LLLLSLACARLALRLAQLLCVRPRPASSASAFASSASRSAKLEDISTDRPPEHEARSAATSCAPALAQVTRLRPQAGGRQAAGLAQARPKARAPRGRAPTGAPTGLALYALRERKHRPAPDTPALLRLQTAGPAGALLQLQTASSFRVFKSFSSSRSTLSSRTRFRSRTTGYQP